MKTKNILKFLMAASGILVLSACNDHDDNDSTSEHSAAVETSAYVQTKTPYKPQQDLNSYQSAPTGFQPVFTELVARHGSRGLSSIKYDLALYNLWKQAKADHALTPLGEQLGADIEAMMKVNILLGYGVSGIRQSGYGNESQLGIEEHRGIADRLLQRLPSLFNTSVLGQMDIAVQSSGVDRAVDSAKFFTNELITKRPDLKEKIRPVSYTSLDSNSNPSIDDQGVDRLEVDQEI